jgi:hypothetical protein
MVRRVTQAKRGVRLACKGLGPAQVEDNLHAPAGGRRFRQRPPEVLHGGGRRAAFEGFAGGPGERVDDTPAGGSRREQQVPGHPLGRPVLVREQMRRVEIRQGSRARRHRRGNGAPHHRIGERHAVHPDEQADLAHRVHHSEGVLQVETRQLGRSAEVAVLAQRGNRANEGRRMLVNVFGLSQRPLRHARRRELVHRRPRDVILESRELGGERVDEERIPSAGVVNLARFSDIRPESPIGGESLRRRLPRQQREAPAHRQRVALDIPERRRFLRCRDGPGTEDERHRERGHAFLEVEQEPEARLVHKLDVVHHDREWRTPARLGDEAVQRVERRQ